MWQKPKSDIFSGFSDVGLTLYIQIWIEALSEAIIELFMKIYISCI